MAKKVTMTASAFAVLHYENQNRNDHTSNPAYVHRNDTMYLKFQMPSDGTEFNQIYTATGSGVYPPGFMMLIMKEQAGYVEEVTENAFAVGILPEIFDPNTATYLSKQENIENIGYINAYNKEISEASSGNGIWHSLSGVVDLIKAVKTGLALDCINSDTTSGYAISTASSKRPELTIYVDNTKTCGLGIVSVSPASGIAPRAVANVFTWAVEADGLCLESLKQTSAVFRWRASLETTVHEIEISGDTQSVTIPANTFPSTSDGVYWQVEVTANSGVTTTSDWIELSTVDALPTVTPVSPVNTAVDSTQDNIFRWRYSISTGTPQKCAYIETSKDGETWSLLESAWGEEQYCVISAGELDAAVKYWRVYGLNSDTAEGEPSEPARIIVIAAPTTPVIRVESTAPRPEISWQTSEQEAYQVEVDGKIFGGTHYGAEQAWKCPEYLTNGNHTVRVRAQNQYGMWSEWGSVVIPVANTPGEAIALSAQASSVADLSWQTSGSYDFYLVYRNGKPIAKLTQTQYTDELSSGSTTYQVRGCYEDSSNYGLSSAVTVTITTGQYVTLYGIASGKKVTLKHCGLKNQPVQNAINRDIQYIFMYGSTYPHAERSEFVTKKVGGTAVFLPDEDKAGFDALIGELVCLKTQSGEMVIGYLNETSDTSRVNPDKSVVNFSIQQIDYAEVIDIDS